MLLLIFTQCKLKQSAKKNSDENEHALSSSSANDILFASKYIDGCSARMRGNISEALKLFNACLSLNPNNAAVKYELATVNKLLGVNDIALQYAKECASQEPKNIWYQLLLVDCYRAVKQYNNSIKIQEQLVKSNPNNSEFKENLAIEYTYVGQFNKAYDVYTELEKKYGINEQLVLNKIKLLQQEKKYSTIETELNKLIDSAPENARFHSYLADHYEYIKQPEKAKQIYDHIIQLDPNNPTVHLALSDYYKLKGDEEASFNELKLAFQNPDLDVYAKFNIAQVFYKTFLKYPDSPYGEQGLVLVGIMLKTHPNAPESNGIKGDFSYLQKNIPEAAKYYYISAIKDKSNYKIWEKLLNCENMLYRFDSLEKHSAEAVELFPNQPYVYYFNGLANLNLNNYKKASTSLKDGLEFVIDDKILMSNFYSHLGDAYHYLNDHVRSDKAFEDALKINADNTYILNNYAYYLSQRKEELEKAEKLSRKSVELQPNEPNYMDTYGLILFLGKKYTQANDWLKKAAELTPNNPNVLEHYGDCLFMLNNINEATRLWQKAFEIGGNKERLSKKIKEKKIND